MSHIVKIKTQIKDLSAVQAACQRLKLPAPTQGTTKLFSGEVSGVIVRLPDWRYPAVFDTTTGEAQYHNYGGKWGDQKQLDRFLQSYAVEATKVQARKKGFSVTEQPLQDGSIKLTINVGGAA